LDGKKLGKRPKYLMHNSPKQNPASSSSIKSVPSAMLPTGAVTKPSFSSVIDVSKSSSNSLATQPEGSKTADVKQDGAVVYDNALAELEEWLLSGAVIITH
jgi:hypothetical protein